MFAIPGSMVVLKLSLSHISLKLLLLLFLVVVCSVGYCEYCFDSVCHPVCVSRMFKQACEADLVRWAAFTEKSTY